VDSNVIISWKAALNNGSPIIAYRITIMNHFGAFIEEGINCNGNDTTVV
jgi:hypothetical protein